MHEIQLIVIKLIKIILVASLIPAVVLLLIAAYNDRVRRVILWIMTPLAALSLVAYVILAPRRLSTAEDWTLALASLKNSLQANLPFLLLLAVIGILAYLFGPALRVLVKNAIHRNARREYLTALLEWIEPRAAGYIEMEGRTLPAVLADNQMPHLRITGEPGSGKSTLMRCLLRQQVRLALEDEYRPLPVWLDLDDCLALPVGLESGRLETLLPVQTRFLGWLLKREGKEHRLVFLVDSSVQNHGMIFASTGGLLAAKTAAGKLAKTIERFTPCPFIVAVPPGILDGSFNHLVEAEQPLEVLSEDGILAAVQALTGDPAAPLAEMLKADSGIWNRFACRPAFLSWLAKFYKKNRRLPKDARELFRETIYPPKIPPAQVERALIGMVSQAARSGEYWIEPDDLLDRQRSSSPGKSSPKTQDHRGMKLAGEMAASGLLRLPPDTTVPGRSPRAAFAHPILLAYATALAWHANQAAALALLEKVQGPPPAPNESEPADINQADPILADALVIFNNIETDPQRLELALAALIETASAGDAGRGSGGFLAAQCLLAMPRSTRPARLVKQVTGWLMEEMAYNPEASALVRLLLEPLDEPVRLAIYTDTLLRMDETRLEQTLRRMAEWNAPGEMIGENELHLILRFGSVELCQVVGKVWAASEPKEAASLLQQLYEQGPVERRALALRLMGQLPREAVGSYLPGLLETEKDPALRVVILNSLAASGVDITAILLNITSDRHEDDSVRVYAAEHLANSSSPELHTSGVVREIVRISRLPLPEQASFAIQRLLETLRDHIPADTSRWEEVVNPYVVGRPVTDPRMFIGRADLLRDLCIAVDNATPVLLTGEHGSGKTSLLYRLAATLKEEAQQGVPVRAVLFDMQGLQPHEFFETAIRTLIEGLADPNLVADPNVPRPYTDQRFAGDLNDLLEYQQSKLGRESRLALLVDNADGFLSYPPAMHAALRRILTAAASCGLAVVLFGVDPLSRWPHPEPPFYSNFLHRPLPRLAREEAVQLIATPVAGSFQYESQAVDDIFMASQGRPDEIQSICQRLVSRLLASGERTITAGMVGDALQNRSPRAALLAQAESALSKMMDWLEAHPEAPNPHVEEQMKQAWSELQKAMVQQVVRLRKGKG